MLVCKKCKRAVYLRQRDESFIKCPYYCCVCEEFLDYDDVEAGK